ncbi:MAG: dUTP diphosphatase [Planctomycetota bacterium]
MPHEIPVAVSVLDHFAGLELPVRASAGAAGVDLAAAVAAPQTVAPGERVLIPTGLCIGVPEGYEAQVRPRSGLALKHGLAVLNSPGTIDSDYRGEVKIILANLGRAPVTIERGMRIAQLVLAPVVALRWERLDSLGATARGSGGFGSTGAD